MRPAILPLLVDLCRPEGSPSYHDCPVRQYEGIHNELERLRALAEEQARWITALEEATVYFLEQLRGQAETIAFHKKVLEGQAA